MIRDLRFAFRMLLKTPAFTAIAVLALALGIGASTTTFSSVNAILLRPLPHLQDQHRILYLSQYFPRLGEHDLGLSLADMPEFAAARSLEGVGGAQEATYIISGERPQRYLGAHVSANLFSLLGVQPILGRSFRAGEDAPGAPPVALLGYQVWQKEFGGSPGVIGRVVPVNGKQATVVGVMPAGFRFPETSDIWMPFQPSEKDLQRGNFSLRGYARLKKGVSLEEGRTELEAIAGRLAAAFPATHSGCGVRLKLLRDELAEETRALVLLMMGAVIFVHLIACANVANLLLARGATRAKEIAVRLALGASRRQIIRHLLAESFVLGAAGSAAGILVAVWGVDLMVATIPVEIPYFIHFDLDWRVILFALGTGFVSSLVFGLFPALQASRPNLVETLKEGGRAGSGGARGLRVRNALVVSEVALALILLVGAGLMLRSFLKLQNADIGVDEASTLTFRVGLPPVQYRDQRDVVGFFEKLMPRLRRIPGVESSGATSSLPASGDVGLGGFSLFGEPEPTQLQEARLAHAVSITPGFLEVARIPLLRGRAFSESDGAEAPPVVMIDEVAARAWFPGLDPVGQRLRTLDKLGEKPKWLTVVGVVRRVEYERLTKQRHFPVVYMPESQKPSAFMSVLLRTKGEPMSLVKAAQNAVLSVNDGIPIYRVLSMEEVVAQSYWDRRFFGTLFVLFAGLALFLASLGLYGVMAYSVRQRTQEIGVRIALGAQARDVLGLVTGHGVRLILLGLMIGFFGAFFLVRLLDDSLHGIPAHDPVSFALVPLLLLAVGLVACYLPARTVLRLDPAEALRYE